mmetsp:Transcript_78955/g.143902  ORF Transcript_78955/g.143902 Transcript_78955/m.143902 type:complete len:817 (+) Transcript_78955:75-2525(+)
MQPLLSQCGSMALLTALLVPLVTAADALSPATAGDSNVANAAVVRTRQHLKPATQALVLRAAPVKFADGASVEENRMSPRPSLLSGNRRLPHLHVDGSSDVLHSGLSLVQEGVALNQQKVVSNMHLDNYGIQHRQRLSSGTRVVVQGLESAQDLNGKDGVVKGFDVLAGRYVVQMADGGPPRRIRLEHLQPLEQAAMDDSVVYQSEAPRIQPGTHVRLVGLVRMSALNGRVGVVRHFDYSTGRYVVVVPHEPPKRIKSENLQIAERGLPTRDVKSPASKASSICQSQLSASEAAALDFPPGTKVLLRGLTSPAALKGHWNGMAGVVHCFDTDSQRYVVALSDGTPKKLRKVNLLTAESTQSAGLASGSVAGKSAASICQQRGSAASLGPGGLPPGTKVALQGLASPAAAKAHLNGMVATVHCFDDASQRYVVALPGGVPKKIRIDNLRVLARASDAPESSTASDETAAQGQLSEGSRVRITGLRALAELNGQFGTVRGFDKKTERYVVELPGGVPKRIRPANLIVSDMAQAIHHQSPDLADRMEDVVQLSICNAYPQHVPLQVFVHEGNGTRYAQVVRDLYYQSCVDVRELPQFFFASMSFVIGRYEVARMSLNSARFTAGVGLELVVYRNDANSMKAAVHESDVNLQDGGAYYLHLVGAYAGASPLELHIKRGQFVEQLPLGKSYRLTHEQPISVVLSDGSRRLQLAFQPRRAHTYCVLTTGVDEGLHGEPRRPGLVAHEIGAWTSSEEMVDEQPPEPPAESDESAGKDDAANTADAQDEASSGDGSDDGLQPGTDRSQAPSWLLGQLGNVFSMQ